MRYYFCYCQPMSAQNRLQFQITNPIDCIIFISIDEYLK